MRKRLFPALVFFALGLLLLGAVSTARGDPSTRLIELLIEKGILTREEAEALKKEAVGEENRQPPVASGPTPGRDLGPKPGGDAALLLPDWVRQVEVGYDEGAYIKSADDRFLLKMNVGVQPLFVHRVMEDRDDTSTFRIRRARYYASGQAFYPWLQYSTQLTLEGGSSALRDAYLEATCLDYLQPRVGQFKVPFDREFLKSGFDLQFIERSIASGRFSLQRDIGVQVSGSLAGKQLGYAVGMFNGSGGNRNNVDTDYMYVGRAVWTPFGSHPSAQPPLEEKDPLLALGVAGAYMPNLNRMGRRSLAGVLGNANIVPTESDVSQFTADLAFKYSPFSAETGYFYRKIEPKAAYAGADAWGVYAQAGYFLVEEKLEFATRYSYVDPDNPTGTGTEKQHEATFGLNYYICGHRLKAQLNYSRFVTEAAPQNREDHAVQSTLVLLF